MDESLVISGERLDILAKASLVVAMQRRSEASHRRKSEPRDPSPDLSRYRNLSRKVSRKQQ
jgi:hypothetical protein